MDACGDEDSIESLGIFFIPIVKKKSGVLDQPVFTGQVTGNLFHSGFIGRVGGAAQNDPAGLDVNEEQDIEGGQADTGPDFRSEKVCGPEHVLVSADELCPSHVAFAFVRGAQAVFREDVADGFDPRR